MTWTLLSRRLPSALLAAGLLLPSPGPAKDPPKAELVLKDTHGQRVRLSDLRGKVVVLNFWATWCGPCNAEMPMLVEAEKEYGPRSVAFIGASLDEPKGQSKIPGFLATRHIGFPVWIGANGDDLDRLGLGVAVPATAFLDAEGHILARILGQMRGEEVRERLDWLTGPKTAPPPNPLVKHLEGK
jgi:thiol-disulfide isomerase/thioredoxin